jgi:hypothetical protein
MARIKSEIERMGWWERSKRFIVTMAKNQHSPALHIMPPWMKPTSNTWAKQLSSALAVMLVHSFRPPHATTYPINSAKHHETSRSNSFSPSTPPLFAMHADSRADLPVPPNASDYSSGAPLTSCKGASLHLPWLWSYSNGILCWEAAPLFSKPRPS